MMVKTTGKNRPRLIAALAVLAQCLLVGPLWAEEIEDVDNYRSEESVELDVGDVPAPIMEAALAARRGVYITRVTRDLEADDDHYYSFEGSQSGRYWVIVVRADGKVTKVREEHDPPNRRRD